MTREDLSATVRSLASDRPFGSPYEDDALLLVGLLPDSALDGMRVAESGGCFSLVWANASSLIVFKTTGYGGFDVAVSASGSPDFVTDRFFAGADGAAEKLARLFEMAQRSN